MKLFTMCVPSNRTFFSNFFFSCKSTEILFSLFLSFSASLLYFHYYFACWQISEVKVITWSNLLLVKVLFLRSVCILLCKLDALHTTEQVNLEKIIKKKEKEMKIFWPKKSFFLFLFLFSFFFFAFPIFIFVLLRQTILCTKTFLYIRNIIRFLFFVFF